MKADDYQMSKVFLGGGDIQYVLPIFQREYAWEQDEWQTLLDDVIETYHESQNTHHEHFLGSLVVIEEDSKKTLFQSYTLVDGQQRLTSISLLLCALRDTLDDPSVAKQIDKYLLNIDQQGQLRYKIVPTERYGDRQAYRMILEGKPAYGLRSRIVKAYSYFRDNLLNVLANPVIDSHQFFSCILSSMYIVFIELDRTDKPYKIFESLNHKGKALTEADLVRNYVAMRLPANRQQQVFDEHWLMIENLLSEQELTARIPELTAFLRHYLAFRSGELPREDRVYIGFRNRIEKRLKADDDEFIAEIETLHQFAGYYDKLLRPAKEPQDNIREQLERLNVLQATTAYPLLMHFYHLYNNETISSDEFVRTLRVVENYLVRRFLAGEPTNYHNSMFKSLANDLWLTGAQSADTLAGALGERNYPSDNRIRQRLHWNRIYSSGKSKRIAFVFESLNQIFDSDIALAGPGTVEHIMPQSLSNEWRTHLGESWQEVHREFLHTIGNLTIVTQDWNTRKLSNKPYSEKRKELKNHGIHLNSKYFSNTLASWDADSIKARADYLAGLALDVWPAFAEPPRSEGVKGTTPISLTVRDRHYNPNSWFGWRGMLLQMVNFLHELQLLTDFDEANREFGWWIEKDKYDSPKYYRQSSAGWWIYVNLTAESVVRFCGMLANYCGLSDDEWSFTYE